MKNVKKITAMLLALAMLLCLCGCGKEPEKEEPKSAVQELFDQGYLRTSLGFVRGKVKALLVSLSGESYYVFSAPSNLDIEAEYDALDFFSDDFDAKVDKWLAALENGSLEDVSSMIPGDEEIGKYVGKTIGECGDLGFNVSSSLYSDEQVNFTLANDVYEMSADVDPASSTEDDESAYVITNAVFSSLSPDVIGEPFDAALMLKQIDESGSVQPFFDNNFATITSGSPEVGPYVIRFTNNEDGQDYIYDVTLEFTAEDKEEYDRIESTEYDDYSTYGRERKKLLGSLAITELKDLGELIPTKEELASYAGKTLADLEAAGYSYAGFSIGENKYYQDGLCLLGVVTEDDGDVIVRVEFVYLK